MMGEDSINQLALIQEWAYLEKQIPKGEHAIRWLEGCTSYNYRQIDFVRHVRNEIAHGGEVFDSKVVKALQMAQSMRAELRVGHAERMKVKAPVSISLDWASHKAPSLGTAILIGNSGYPGRAAVRCFCGTVSATPSTVSTLCPGCNRNVSIVIR